MCEESCCENKSSTQHRAVSVSKKNRVSGEEEWKDTNKWMCLLNVKLQFQLNLHNVLLLDLLHFFICSPCSAVFVLTSFSLHHRHPLLNSNYFTFFSVSIHLVDDSTRLMLYSHSRVCRWYQCDNKSMRMRGVATVTWSKRRRRLTAVNANARTRNWNFHISFSVSSSSSRVYRVWCLEFHTH